MKLEGTRAIGAPATQVWAALFDPEVLVKCIPGCESIEQISDHQLNASLAVRLGPVRARFSGKVLMSDVQPGRGCVMTFEGSGGAAGFAKGSSEISLESTPEGTLVRYTSTASVGGKLGQVGSRLIESAAKSMAGEFFDSFSASWPVVAQKSIPIEALPTATEVPPEPTVAAERKQRVAHLLAMSASLTALVGALWWFFIQ